MQLKNQMKQDRSDETSTFQGHLAHPQKSGIREDIKSHFFLYLKKIT